MCVLAWDKKWGGLSKCCWLFVSQNWAFFSPSLFTFERRACLWRCGCLWKLTGNLAQGANADPKRAGQMSAHTPAFCRRLPAEMSNTMMWWEAAGELSAALQGSHDTDKDTVSYTRIHVELHQKAARSLAIIWPVRITTEPSHQSDPRSDWNDHLSLANTATVRTIHLTLLSNFNNSIIVLHMSGPQSLDNTANRFKVPQIH